MNRACQICGCTETEACKGQCSWMVQHPEPGEPDICSACYLAANMIADGIQDFRETARHPTPERHQLLLNFAIQIVDCEAEELESLIAAPTAQETSIILAKT